LITGNFAHVPEVADSFAPKIWNEDQLLLRNPDGNGHAANVWAPGGFIARFQLDGSNWQLVSMGQRNTYDAAFHDNGELFAYDADMEWDFGMSWYRPTRISHIVPGTELGWRNGTGKWPAYYEDSMAPVLNIGPGSPTGEVAGRGFKAPTKYASYPAKEREMNFELARMLCYLQAPNVVSRTLKLMDEASAADAEEWKTLVERNSKYGNDINQVTKNHPPTAQIHYIYCLRSVKGPWKGDERRRVFNWFREIESRSGGNSYAKFIAMIRKQIYENGTPEEQKLFAVEAKAPAQKPKALPPVKGPGRDWTVEEIKKVTAEGLTNRNLENGKAMFEASLCATCHKFGAEGGAQGPDLTNLSGRFKIEDLAHSIVDPSQVISDQYEFTEILKQDGTTITGRVLNEKDEIIILGINPFDFVNQVEISRHDIKSMAPSKVSPMPPAMINRLNADELKDLFAYLLGVK